jgi:sugar transferase (PEP-CTERM/EpsH1 system associated)
MRVLAVDEEIPFPLNSGKRIRTFNLLKHLARRHEIVFVCRQHEGIGETDKQGFENAGIKAIIVPHQVCKKSGTGFYLALLGNLFSRFPYSVSSHYSVQLVAALQELVDGDRFDLIHCEWTPYAVNLRSLPSLPSVVVAHNVEAKIWHRSFQVEANPLKKGYIYLQWKKMEAFERDAFSYFTRVIAVSEEDRLSIAQTQPEDRVVVVENGVDTEYFNPSGMASKRNSLVFTGAMDWRPNVDSMLYFLDEIWPMVVKEFPDSTLTIVGRNPAEVLRRKVANLASVQVTGTADDVRPYVEEASVYIVPLRIGGGSRLKILEALSMCKPVVSTSIGAEGLDLMNDCEILIADEPAKFVGAIARLFRDSVLRGRLGSAGRSLVEKRYQWKTLARKLEDVWQEAVCAGVSAK